MGCINQKSLVNPEARPGLFRSIHHSRIERGINNEDEACELGHVEIWS